MAIAVSHTMQFFSGLNTVPDTVTDISDVHFYKSDFGSGVLKKQTSI